MSITKLGPSSQKAPVRAQEPVAPSPPPAATDPSPSPPGTTAASPSGAPGPLPTRETRAEAHARAAHDPVAARRRTTLEEATPLAKGGGATAETRAERRTERLRDRLTTDALGVLNTTPPTNLEVNGVTVPVHGATESELETIRATLSRLPAAHLEAIPRIVVGDTIANGTRTRGGNSIDGSRVEELNAASPFRDLADAGWPQQARLELTHESLRRVTRAGVSQTLLHEVGHFADRAHGFSGRLSAQDLGNVSYGGVNRREGEDARGSVYERFAQAYMQYYSDRLTDRTALATMERLLGPRE